MCLRYLKFNPPPLPKKTKKTTHMHTHATKHLAVCVSLMWLSGSLSSCRTPYCSLSNTSLALSGLQMWSSKTTPKESNQQHLTLASTHPKFAPSSGLSARGTRWTCNTFDFLTLAYNIQPSKDVISAASPLSALHAFHLTTWYSSLSCFTNMAQATQVNKMLPS